MNRNHLKSLSSQLGGAKRRRGANGTRSAFATVSFIIAASLLAVLLAACPSTTTDTTAPTFTLSAISPAADVESLTITADEAITLLGADEAANIAKLTVTNDVGGTDTAVNVTGVTLGTDLMAVTITIEKTTFVAGKKVTVAIAAGFVADKAATPNNNIAATLEVTVEPDTTAPEFTLSAITAGSSDTLTIVANEAITLLSTDNAVNIGKLTVKNDAAGTSPTTLTVSTVALENDETTVTITLDASATFTIDEEVSVDIAADFAADKAATPNNNVAATVKTTVEAKKFTVSYDLNNGEGTAPDSVEVVDGETVATAPTDPTRTGHTFDGWHTTAGGGTAFVFGAAGTGTAVTADTILYAQWTIIEYTVTYDANSGIDAPNPATVTYGGTIASAPTNPTRTGYTFTGWDTKSDGTGTAFEFGAAGIGTAVTADITVYAQWGDEWTVANVGYTAPSPNPEFTVSQANANLATLDFAGTALVIGTDFEVTLVNGPAGAPLNGHVTLSTSGVIGVTGDIEAADAGAYTFKVEGINTYNVQTELTDGSFTFTLASN